MKYRVMAIAAALAAGAFVSSAGAVPIEIFNFSPKPASNSLPEFVFNGANFTTGSGATNNGDGNLPVGAQTQPGLQMNMDFFTPPVSGGQPDPFTFYDTALQLTGFAAAGPATNVGGTITQNLFGGGFTVTATDGTVLLTGTAVTAQITGLAGTSVGSTLSATVVYTGGALLPYLPGIHGGFSFTDLLMNTNLTIVGGGPVGALQAFDANGTGNFNVDTAVPLPAAAWGGISLMGLLGGVQALRRRSMSR